MTTLHSPKNPFTMTPIERRLTVHLSAVYALRMLGMFIILPVFALYAETLAGGDDRFWVGFALGAYGLTQAILQIPFGWASDRWGRKPVIFLGLIVFALGSFIAAASSSLLWVIVGRMLQGAGAISGVLIALIADGTRYSVRTKAMAAIGMTIGGTFAVSLMIAPVLTALFGVPGIFVMTGILAILAFIDIKFFVPDTNIGNADPNDQLPFWRAFFSVLNNATLARLNFGIFALHAVLMAIFVQIPFNLRQIGLPANHHWMVYLPILLVSIAFLMPTLKRMDHPRYGQKLFLGAISVLLLGHVFLAVAHQTAFGLIGGLLLFFIGFNQLEAALPSLISKHVRPEIKGTATGIYSSLQFLGTFAGAAAGGAMAQHIGDTAIFWACVGVVCVWWVIAALGKNDVENGQHAA